MEITTKKEFLYPTCMQNLLQILNTVKSITQKDLDKKHKLVNLNDLNDNYTRVVRDLRTIVLIVGDI